MMKNHEFDSTSLWFSSGLDNEFFCPLDIVIIYIFKLYFESTVNTSKSFTITMGIIKSGRIVIVTSGRFAGKKAVVVKTSEDVNSNKKFGHALGLFKYHSPFSVLKVLNHC